MAKAYAEKLRADEMRRRVIQAILNSETEDEVSEEEEKEPDAKQPKAPDSVAALNAKWDGKTPDDAFIQEQALSSPGHWAVPADEWIDIRQFPDHSNATIAINMTLMGDEADADFNKAVRSLPQAKTELADAALEVVIHDDESDEDSDVSSEPVP